MLRHAERYDLTTPSGYSLVELLLDVGHALEVVHGGGAVHGRVLHLVLFGQALQRLDR